MGPRDRQRADAGALNNMAPIEKAKKHFLGKDGHERLNCAGAILKAFEHLNTSVKDALSHGHGTAPGGECGAYYAAKYLLSKNRPEILKEFEDHFTQLAGSTQCREIRKLKKFSCLGCVEKAAEFLHSHT